MGVICHCRANESACQFRLRNSTTLLLKQLSGEMSKW
jgi:hypothetical protein